MTHTEGNDSLLPIILIDDDTDDLEIMSEELLSLSCQNEIFGFHMPLEALEFMKNLEQQPLMISCDVHMPKMDAYGFRSLMLDNLSHLCHVPFFVLSSVITEREISFGDALQIHGYFIKGFTRESVQQNFLDMFSFIEKRSS